MCVPQASSSSESVEGPCVDCAAKSYDAVVFDVLKVTPEEFAVSDVQCYHRSKKIRKSHYIYIYRYICMYIFYII